MQASSIKLAWKLMLVMGIYLAAIGLFLLLAPQAPLGEEVTYVENTWGELVSTNPKLAEWFLLVSREKGAFALSIAAAVIAISFTSYKKGEKWSWYALLVSGIMVWSGALMYHLTIGINKAPLGGTLVMIGSIIFIVAIALPAKAILGKESI
jgi:uncharacterized membrane protein YgdD (TMEM256/DUF423 family)